MTAPVRPPESSPSPTGSGVAFVALVVASLALAASVDPVVAASVVVSAVGGGLLWASLRGLRGDARSTALGGVGIAVATFLLPGGPALLLALGGGYAASALVACSAVAFLLVACEGAVGLRTAATTLRTPLAVAAAAPIATLVVLAPTMSLGGAALDAVAVAFGRLLGGSLVVVIVVLQVAGLAAALLLPHATATLERLLGPDRYQPPAVVRAAALRPTDVPKWYWIALLAQAAFAPGIRVPAVTVLYTVPTAGPVFRALLDDGLLAGSAMLVAGSLALVVLGGMVQSAVVRAVGEDPAKRVLTAAPAVLGVATLLVTALAEAVGAGGPTLAGTGVSLAYTGWLFVAGAPIAAFATVQVVATLTGDAAFDGLVPDHGPGFALAATAGVGAAVAGSVAGANPIAVVGAVALALVAWGTGEHAAGLGRQLGRDADTTTVEYVRATGLLAVGAAATLGCAALAYLGPPLSVGGDRALVALAFLLVALVTLTARLGFATE